MRCPIGACVALFGLIDCATAQLEFDIVQFASPQPSIGLEFGDIMLTADLNHDGFDDVVASEPWASDGGGNFPGRVWILYGPLFSETKLVTTNEPAKYGLLGFGSTGSPPFGDVGDINADGELDLLIPAPAWNREEIFGIYTGRVHLFIGPSFTEERILYDPLNQTNERFGVGSLLTDLTGDGRDDVLVGAPTASDGSLIDLGRVWWWDGAELAAGVVVPHLLENPVPQSPAWFGYTIREWDVTADVEKELLIAASDVTVCCPLTKGAVYVFDRKTLALVQAIPAPTSHRKFGDARYFGDLNGDDTPDLVISAIHTSYETQFESNTSAGAVLILLGPDYTTVWKTLLSPAPLESESFGCQSYVLDLDKDGDQDIVVGDRGPSQISLDKGRVRVFHGPDYSTTQSLGDFGGLIYVGFGDYVALGDTDGDGFREVLVHAPLVGGDGRIIVYRPRTLTTGATALSVSSGADLVMELDLSPDKAGHSYLGVVSLSGSQPGLVMAPGSYLQLQPDAATFMGLALVGTSILKNFAGTLDADGRATLTLHWPAGFAPGLAGSTLTVAAITSEDGKRPGAGSNALSIALEP